MSRRNKAILMDSLSGVAHTQIAIAYGICEQRVSQIVAREKKMIGWHPAMTKQQAGAALCRQSKYLATTGTPEAEYWQIEGERR